MSLIQDEIYVGACGNGSVAVLQKTKGETVRPWAILNPDLGNLERMTPRELRELGKELIAIGKKAGREYTASGKVRATLKGGAS